MAEENRVMETVERSAHGAMHLFLGNTLSTVILAVCSIIIGRLLGPTNYGTILSCNFCPKSLKRLD